MTDIMCDVYIDVFWGVLMLATIASDIYKTDLPIHLLFG